MVTELEDNKKILADINKDLTAAKNFRTGKETVWNDCYKLYRSYLDSSENPYSSNLFIPYSFWTVETIVPRLLGTGPELYIHGRELQDEVQADIVEELLKYQWEKIELNQKIEDMVRQGLIYGTSFMKIGWDDEEKIPSVENVDILDLFIDPEASCISDARFVIFRTMKDIETIKNNPNYKNLDQLEDAASKSNDGSKASRYSVQSMSEPQSSDVAKKVEIMEYWSKDKLVVVAGKKIVLREDKNPHKDGRIPFISFKDYPVAFELYGIGEVETIRDLQREANILRNQMLDAGEFINNPMYEKDPIASINTKNIQARPGLILPRGLKPFIHGGLPASSFSMAERLANEIQSTTGVTDYQLGGQSTGANLNRTATGVISIQESGNQRFRLKLRHLEEALKDLVEMVLARNQQYMVKEQVVRIIGNAGADWVTVKASDIKGNYDIVVQLGSPGNKDVEKMQLKDFMGVIANIQQLSQGALQINWNEIASMMAKKFDIKNIDDIMSETPPPPPPSPEQAQPETQVQDMMKNMDPAEIQKFLSTLPPQDAQTLRDAMSRNLPPEAVQGALDKQTAGHAAVVAGPQQNIPIEQMMGGNSGK